MNQPPPPPGWYQDPTGPGLRWWDGVRWTDFHQAAVPLPPPPVVGPLPPGVPGQPGAAPPLAPVKPRYEQKWWHIPLLVFLGVASTLFYVLVQFLS